MKYTVEIDEDKTIPWYKEGTEILHREDGPAVEYANGDKYWYQNGLLHRLDGPAVEYADGSRKWWQNGKLHRDDGPAVELANGTKHWYQNGKRHRLDGPAREFANGHKEWYYEGKEVSEREHNKLSGKATSCDGKIVNIDGKNYKLVEV